MSGGVVWTTGPAEAAAALVATAPAARGGTRWTLIGDVAVLWGAEAPPAAAELARWAGVEARPATVGGLALVTQVGAAFQQEYPDVEVLVDRGRHLVVDASLVPPEPAEHVDWKVEPLPADTAVVTRHPPVPGRAEPEIGAVVDSLSPSSYEQDVTHLASLATRHSLSAGFKDAAAYCVGRLEAAGYTVTRESVSVGGGTSENLVADRRGAGAERRRVLVTAHLDSVNTAGGPAAAAPGADDNASGAAGAMTLSRALAEHAFEADTRVILFGGEEQGLHGSRQHVAALPADERSRIAGVVNLDMVGRRNGPVAGVLLEGAPVSSWLVDRLAAAAAAWTGLTVETSLAPFASDHVPFIDAGVPAVLTIEGNDRANTDVHTARDTLATLDHGLALEILRMDVAVLAELLGLVRGGAAAAVPRPAGPVVSRAPGSVDVFALGPGRSAVHGTVEG
ncbi:MAG TPA: M28 family metallopeptidase [Jiangellales bacterium]|nr:M28 family metallopeptidase [Jiangellales bacterium]